MLTEIRAYLFARASRIYGNANYDRRRRVFAELASVGDSLVLLSSDGSELKTCIAEAIGLSAWQGCHYPCIVAL